MPELKYYQIFKALPWIFLDTWCYSLYVITHAHYLDTDLHLFYKKCYLCLRTCVTQVTSLYRVNKGGWVSIFCIIN